MVGDWIDDAGMHHTKGQIILNGGSNEVWSMTDGGVSSPVNKYFTENSLTVNIAKSDSSVISNFFEDGLHIYDNDVIGIAYEGTPATKSIRIRTSQTSLEDFKTWLSNHPITVEYELATPTVTAFTQEQRTAWNNLKLLHTYDDITIITSANSLKPTLNGEYCLKVGEGLENIVTNLENQVVELTEALENKTAGSIPNVFVQSTEPTSKDGIWLQTNKTAEHYISDDNIFMGGTWSLASDTASIPYDFFSGSAVAIGTDIYLLGGDSSKTKNYKYNTLTDTYTQLTDIPYQFYQGAAVAIGTDIYLLGSYDSKTTAYKYNTLTDTYTQLTNVPYQFYQGAAVAIGTDIYLLGSYHRTNTRIYHLENKSYATDNSVIIAQGRTYDVGYNVKLFETNFESAYQPLYGFADAWFYTTQDGLIKNIPTYYGDGTSWIKFKN